MGILVAAVAAVSAFAQTPVIANRGIVNSVTLDRSQPVAAGSIVNIFGDELAGSRAAADSVPLSTAIASVSVTFNDIPAAVRQVSPTLVSVQVPWNVTGDAANVVVTRDGVASEAKSVALGKYSPGVYAVGNLAVTNLALALNSDGSLAQPAGAIMGLTSHAALTGDNVVILATGLGPVEDTPANGAASKDKVRNVITLPQVMLGEIGAPVVSATLAPDFVGAYQVQVTVPDTSALGDAVPIQLQIEGVTSPKTTTMAIKLRPQEPESPPDDTSTRRPVR